ncbi:MAG TPA: MASE1 domain-containing protein, partial [Polyangiaceae bacterium]|nr:MASE1 domain-containing protein [Polyangiaceae bacterium]
MTSRQGPAIGDIARQSLVLGLAYYAVSTINLNLTVTPVGLAAFWVASGLSFAFFVQHPLRSWPGLGLGVFLACVAGNSRAGYAPELVVAMALANTLEPAIGAGLFVLLNKRRSGYRSVAIVPLMAAGTLASACGALIGGGAWWLLTGASFLSTALHWLFSDLVGILSIAPFLLALQEPLTERARGEAGLVETTFIFVGQAAAIVTTFVLLPAVLEVQGAVFAVQCFLLWGGLRLRAREATALAVLHSTAILGVTAFGMGPFAFSGDSLDGRFIRLQVFLSISTAFYLALFETVQHVRHGQRLISRSRDELRQVLDSSPDAVFIHAAGDGRIVDVNERALQMYRCRREDVLGNDGFDLDRLKQASQTELAAFEWRAQRLDGTSFWAEVALRSARIGEEPRVIAVVRDIERRRQMEERLRQAQKLELIGRLTGGIVHDFRNINTALAGLVSLLKDDVPKNSPADETLAMLDATVANATELTEKLLSFSRKSSKAVDALHLHVQLTESVELLRRTLPKSIDISSDFSALRDSIDGDAAALPNMFLNLALNARDAMPEGGKLQITTTNRELDADFCSRSIAPIEPATFIEVCFSDDGHGIASEHREQLFQPFFTTKESRGTGLGLASVLACMQEHHGT